MCVSCWWYRPTRTILHRQGLHSLVKCLSHEYSIADITYDLGPIRFTSPPIASVKKRCRGEIDQECGITTLFPWICWLNPHGFVISSYKITENLHSRPLVSWFCSCFIHVSSISESLLQPWKTSNPQVSPFFSMFVSWFKPIFRMLPACLCPGLGPHSAFAPGGFPSEDTLWVFIRIESPVASKVAGESPMIFFGEKYEGL